MLNDSIYKGPRTLSVMLTYACPAACKNCGTVSSPNDKNHVDLRTILSAIDQATELQFANVVFTGGEATLRWDDLLTSIKHATGKGLRTRLVTNAYWATSPEEALRRVRLLTDAGLNEINFSTGDEHVRFIPMDQVAYAVAASLEQSLAISVMIELRAERNITRDKFLSHPVIQSLPAELTKLVNILESPWMPLNPSKQEQYPEGVAINSDNVHAQKGCDSVLQSYVLAGDGRVAACCGLGMRLIKELNVGLSKGEDFLARTIEDSENDFFKVLLHYRGPERILAWAASKNKDIKWENMYAHKCQACIRIYKDPVVRETVKQHYTELYASTLQAIWLEEEFIPGEISRGGIVNISKRREIEREAEATAAVC
jgi:hypothetical protein